MYIDNPINNASDGSNDKAKTGKFGLFALSDDVSITDENALHDFVLVDGEQYTGDVEIVEVQYHKEDDSLAKGSMLVGTAPVGAMLTLSPFLIATDQDDNYYKEVSRFGSLSVAKNVDQGTYMLYNIPSRFNPEWIVVSANLFQLFCIKNYAPFANVGFMYDVDSNHFPFTFGAIVPGRIDPDASISIRNTSGLSEENLEFWYQIDDGERVPIVDEPDIGRRVTVPPEGSKLLIIGKYIPPVASDSDDQVPFNPGPIVS